MRFVSMPISRTSLTTLLLVVAALTFTPGTVSAATTVGGSITTNTTWTLAGSPYLVQNSVFVNAKVTLTIEPGVVVKVNGTFGRIVVFSYGVLYAVGTAQNRIVFTSMQDDSIAGDSGGDGPTTGAPGQWYHLGVNGAATLRYVDVRYGGWGSANEAYGGIAVWSGGYADLDYCALSSNQRSGITVGANSTAVVAHTVMEYNAVGASGTNAALTIRANSSLSYNTHTGLYLNVTDTYTGTRPTLTNSEVRNNGEFGIRLIMNSTLPDAAAPHGHENNIWNNKAGAAQRQLAILWPLKQSDWTNNYWGPIAAPPATPCIWAPPETAAVHIAPTNQDNYCENPPDGPTTNQIYLFPGCGNEPARCRADWVKTEPYATSPYDNSNK